MIYPDVVVLWDGNVMFRGYSVVHVFNAGFSCSWDGEQLLMECDMDIIEMLSGGFTAW